jgi:hypothetical protein
MSLTFGTIKHPAFEDRLIKDANNFAWDPLGPRYTFGCVQHTMVTSLWSCDAYFRSGAAKGLTDYGIGGVTDGADDGLILRWNDPTGAAHNGVSADRWPWASGPCRDSSGDALPFIKKYGPNAVNGYLVSIERSDGGDPNIPASNKYIDSFVALTAYYADLGQIPWSDYPNNPNTKCWSYFWHSEFYGGKSCPAGAKASTSEIQADVKAALKAAQTGGATPDEEGDILADLPKSEHVLDPNLIWPNASTGAVGQLWRDYGEVSGSWGSPAQPWNDLQDDGSKLYVFSNGLVIASKDGKAGVVVKATE